MTDESLARQIRRDIIEMTHNAKASHSGSAMSCADILAVLYNGVINVTPDTVDSEDRDRLILSKGHAGAVVYAALAEKEFFPRQDLRAYYQNGTRFSGHVTKKGVPGVEFSTGSLGLGIGVACGLALGGKKDKRDYHVYAIVGDGECEEGSVWECAMFATHEKLDNFTVIVDRNMFQAMGSTEDVMSLGDLADKWRAFGWNVIEVDGHNCSELRNAFAVKSNKPKCIVAKTVKGKGVSVMENNNLYHYRDPSGEVYEQAVLELGGMPL